MAAPIYDPERVLNLRVEPDVKRRLDALLQRVSTGAARLSRHGLAVWCLERGLLEAERDAAAVLRAPAAPPSAPPVAVEPARAAPPRPVSVAAPSAPSSAPQLDHRQLAIPGTAPAPAHVERPSSPVERSLADRFTAARERASLTIPAALSELDQRGWPVGGVALTALRAELAKPAGALTAEQRAALEGWCRAVEEAPPRPRAPSRERAPSSPRTAEEIERNEALRARYRAAHEAKQLAGEPTAKRIGCSEGTLRHWRDGKLNYLGGDSDPSGQWLTALEGILAELEMP